MPRRLRIAPGGFIYHVLNRAVGRGTIFEDEDDYAAFLRCIEHAQRRQAMRILSYVLMPNHFHLMLWPMKDDELSRFMRLLTVTHTNRWHAHHHSTGSGPLYQGRFKSFPIQADDHLLTVLRYVERNPLRARLVKRAQQWRWGSLHDHDAGALPPWLMQTRDWPVARRSDWVTWVNLPQTNKEEQAIRQCILRGRPLGSEKWVKKTTDRLKLHSAFRDRGRPPGNVKRARKAS